MGVNSTSANAVQTTQLSPRQEVERRPPPAQETQSSEFCNPAAFTQVFEAPQTTD
ncbi:hypothetical protein [Paraglaciecola sp. L1A13]|uniref:hypothetical protein n=1 Tax=Paraglaciecola sp. L1A13 TaxID=2686359 RepID=UPI00131E6736|nr:hypothetical protein [Paraglaciecola sp. L1A13]|tara:strand:- start:561 stop:725 length:165 start_codon:yes stop_codon:yes gene_type:complete